MLIFAKVHFLINLVIYTGALWFEGIFSLDTASFLVIYSNRIQDRQIHLACVLNVETVNFSFGWGVD